MLSEQAIRELLQRVAAGQQTIEQACDSLRMLPFEDAGGFAKLDHHRCLRQGFPEVVFCAGKTPEQVGQIMQRLAERHPRVLGTRASAEHHEATRRLLPEVVYHESARILLLDREPDRPRHNGIVLIAAGTSDLPVAEEAALTLRAMGHAPSCIYDVGVSGLHRLLHHVREIQSANALIVVAGMEGALPSVVAGLVRVPVIAVPTSVGYGASFGGLAALLGMLNSCAPGMSVVNIDNGYGAACMAARINDLACARPGGSSGGT